MPRRIPVSLVPAVLAFALLPLGPRYGDLTLGPQAPPSVPVVLTVTVTDKRGNHVKDLGKNAFEVFDNGKPQQITECDDHDSPAVVGIVFDLSGSISPDTINSGREALGDLVRSSHPDTEFFLVSISNQPQLRQDWTRDPAAVIGAVPVIPPKTKPKGYTAFYDACYLTVVKLISSTNRKRVLVVVSDGQDNNSKHTFQQLERLIETTGVLVYAVGVLGSEDQGSSLGMEGRGILDELAAISGGASYYPSKAAQIEPAFTNIGTELRNQYSLAFQPDTNSLGEMKRHSLKVRIASNSDSRGALRDLKMRTRHGYYPRTNK
jgi:Ca-activated chloride channel family protein